MAAQRLIHALRVVGVGVAWQPLVDRPGGCTPDPVNETTEGERPAGTLVLHADPQGWARCRELLRPTRVIGHTVWETERVPAKWRTEMQAADELWVPTRWNQRAFEAAFDVPVVVVPHVVTTATPAQPPIEIRETTFLVASVSAWDWRKRPDRVIEVFLRAFGPTDDAALVLKTDQWPMAWPHGQTLPTAAHLSEVLPADRRPQVLVDTAHWSEGQVLGLLERADCFLSMTASEGWGLGPFDAACLGTPVVITGFGGQVEWLGADHPGLLPYRRVPADHPYPLFEPGMEWAEPDLDAAVDRLRDLASGRPSILRTAAAELRASVLDRYSPTRVGQLAAAALSAPS